MNIRRLLVANRGEIAARILRTCRQLGIDTVLAVSEADRDALPARLADQVLVLGPGPSAQSYLNLDALLAAVRQSGADALHPGYGFLSENAQLARACEAAGIRFVGPTPQQLDATGDKVRAREHAAAAGLPLVPGGTLTTAGEAAVLAKTLGWPVLVKAVGGGGGRGMKTVRTPDALADTLALARREAEVAFSDNRLYLERYVEHGRHIEVQILGDGQRVIHLGTRDCSIQRRYQKLLEEAPAPLLPAAQRTALEQAAVTFGQYLHYRGAGTVEFLYDTVRNSFHFLEMNARIQVEHPVTEAISGIDLIAEQLRIAEGRPLRLQQADVVLHGHALECRLNAEDCRRDFRPCPGIVTRAVFAAGPGIRVDTHIEAGSQVPPYYDSLLGKLIVWGETRAAALDTLQGALATCRIDGVANNLTLHRALLREPAFREGGVDTGFLGMLLERMDFREALADGHA